MNVILADYSRTGFMKHAKVNQGRYDDVSAIDFQTAMTTVANANSMFESLPANVRKRFSNNPTNFLEFVQNPNNKAEMKSLGILKGNDGIDINGALVPSPQADPIPPESDPKPKEAKPATPAPAE